VTDHAPEPPRRRIKIGRYSLPVPRSKPLRIALGVVLVLGGFLGFLPVLGLWMAPLGFLVLSIDIPIVGRWTRRAQAWWRKHGAPWWKKHVASWWNSRKKK
jgi:hypothetical protein